MLEQKRKLRSKICRNEWKEQEKKRIEKQFTTFGFREQGE